MRSRARSSTAAASQRKLTSLHGLRRAGIKSVQLISVKHLDQLSTQPVDVAEEVHSPEISGIRQMLMLAGFSAAKSDYVLEVVAGQAGYSHSPKAACDRLSRNHELGALLGFHPSQWRALISLMFGTTRGQPGLPALMAAGHPHPMDYSYIRRSATRLLEHPTPAERK